MNRLKELRLKHNYTQEFMAKKLGYASKSGYSMLENSVIKKISIEKAVIISKIFNISIDEFFLPIMSKKKGPSKKKSSRILKKGD